MNVVLQCLLSPIRKAVALRDGAVVLFLMLIMLIMQIMKITQIVLIMQIWSFVCILQTRTCRALARMAQQCSSAGGRERPQRCWATRTTGVTDVYPSVKFMLVAPINASYVFDMQIVYSLLQTFSQESIQI